MARYYALFDSAKELESKSLRKRAGTAGNSVPLDDCEYSRPIMDDFGATLPMLSSDRLLTAGQTSMATTISSTLDPCRSGPRRRLSKSSPTVSRSLLLPTAERELTSP